MTAILRCLKSSSEKGAVYRYFGVSEAAYVALMRAESKGRYFNTHIKDAHHYERVDRSPRGNV